MFHFGSNFIKRFEAHTTKKRFKGFHTSYVAHQGRARGGASSLSEKSCLVVAFRLLFKHTFYGTRHPKTVQRTPSLSPLTQPTLAPPLSCLGVLFPFSFLKKVPTPPLILPRGRLGSSQIRFYFNFFRPHCCLPRKMYLYIVTLHVTCSPPRIACAQFPAQ